MISASFPRNDGRLVRVFFEKVLDLLQLPESRKDASLRPCAHLIAAILVIAACVGATEVFVAPIGLSGEAAAPSWHWGWTARSALNCVVAGVAEEAIFRGVLFPLFARGFAAETDASPRRALWKAAFLQAAIFALLHLSGVGSVDLTGLVALQAVAKVAGAFAFGLCMAALYVRTRNLVVPIFVHGAYDLLSVLPREALRGATVTYLTGTAPDAVVLVGAAIALGIACVTAMSKMR